MKNLMELNIQMFAEFIQSTLLTASNIIDEQSITITYSNIENYYTSKRINIGIMKNGQFYSCVQRELVANSTTTTFELTQEEKNKFYNEMPTVNTINVVYQLYSFKNNNYDITELNRTFTIINNKPIFSDYDYEDSNVNTINITKNNQIIVKNNSNLKILINGFNSAKPQKGATIEYYKINDFAYEYNSSFSKIINNYDKNNVDVYAIDSRGNSTKITKVFQKFIEYNIPNAGIINLNRTNDIDEETTLDFSGTWFNNNFMSNKRNIQNGDDLSGKTIYMQFPSVLIDVSATSNDIITVTNNGVVKTDAIIENGASGSIADWYNIQVESASYDDNLYYIYQYKQSGDIEGNYLNLRSYVLPNNFGEVFSINTNSIAYKYIYIVDENDENNNTINATYQYKQKSNNTYINGTSPLTLTTDTTNNLSLEQTIKGDLDIGFNTNNSYDVKVILTDLIGSYNFYGTVAVGSPAIDIYKNCISLGGSYDESVGGRVQIEGQILQKKSFAKMQTNFDTYVIYNNNTKITEWTSNNKYTFSVGDFIAEPANARIKIPAGTAEYIKTGGLICGYGYMMAEIIINDENGIRMSSSVQTTGVIYQQGGNGYWKAPLSSPIIKIEDTSKDWYLTFYVSPYFTENIRLNEGFGSTTFFQVEKIF